MEVSVETSTPQLTRQERKARWDHKVKKFDLETLDLLFSNL